MNPTPILPGSAVDRKPLAPCHRCGHRREQSGGIWWSGRFVCRSCVNAKVTP